MEKKRLMYALVLAATVFLSGRSVTTQESKVMVTEYEPRVDGLVSSYDRQGTADEKRKDADKLSNLKAEKREAKAKAKKAQRVENEANHVAGSRRWLIEKRRKQRACEQADRQNQRRQQRPELSLIKTK